MKQSTGSGRIDMEVYITGSYTLQAVIHYREVYITGSYTLQAVIHYREFYKASTIRER
jgi:hypothetical protein